MITTLEMQRTQRMSKLTQRVGQIRGLRSAPEYDFPLINRAIHPYERVPITKIANRHVDPQAH